jgi:hypothetical protein
MVVTKEVCEMNWIEYSSWPLLIVFLGLSFFHIGRYFLRDLFLLTRTGMKYQNFPSYSKRFQYVSNRTIIYIQWGTMILGVIMIIFFNNYNWLKAYIYPIIPILVMMIFVHWQEFVVGETNRDISEFQSYYESISKMILKKKEIETTVTDTRKVLVKEEKALREVAQKINPLLKTPIKEDWYLNDALMIRKDMDFFEKELNLYDSSLVSVFNKQIKPFINRTKESIFIDIPELTPFSKEEVGLRVAKLLEQLKDRVYKECQNWLRNHDMRGIQETLSFFDFLRAFIGENLSDAIYSGFFYFGHEYAYEEWIEYIAKYELIDIDRLVSEKWIVQFPWLVQGRFLSFLNSKKFKQISTQIFENDLFDAAFYLSTNIPHNYRNIYRIQMPKLTKKPKTKTEYILSQLSGYYSINPMNYIGSVSTQQMAMALKEHHRVHSQNETQNFPFNEAIDDPHFAQGKELTKAYDKVKREIQKIVQNNIVLIVEMYRIQPTIEFFNEKKAPFSNLNKLLTINASWHHLLHSKKLSIMQIVLFYFLLEHLKTIELKDSQNTYLNRFKTLIGPVFEKNLGFLWDDRDSFEKIQKKIKEAIQSHPQRSMFLNVIYEIEPERLFALKSFTGENYA